MHKKIHTSISPLWPYNHIYSISWEHNHERYNMNGKKWTYLVFLPDLIIHWYLIMLYVLISQFPWSRMSAILTSQDDPKWIDRYTVFLFLQINIPSTFKLHHKAIPCASLLWHTQMAPSCTSIHCSPVVASHLILLHATMQYSSLCVYTILSFSTNWGPALGK